MAPQLKVHYSGLFKGVLLLTAFFTLGIGTIAVWLTSWSWPRILDDEGMTLRSGKRLRWQDLSGMDRVTVVNPQGQRITGRLDLRFGKHKARIVPQSLREGAEVMAFIRKVAGDEAEVG